MLSATQTNGVVTGSLPQPAENWLLDQSAALASPPAAISWGQVSPASYQTNATHLFLTLPAPAGNKFYRLRKP